MTKTASREKACFVEWRKKHCRIVPDGAVHPATYEASDLKLLFVLKEVNNIDDPEWDLRTYLCKYGGRGQTWNNVARWVAALTPGGAASPWDQICSIDDNVRRHRLRGVATMNVKKTSGMGSSNWNMLEQFAREDTCLLKEQFEIYEPDFAVFCGVPLDWIPQFIDVTPRRTQRGIEFREYKEQKYGIAFWHPQARYPAQFLYYSLADAATEIRECGQDSAATASKSWRFR